MDSEQYISLTQRYFARTFGSDIKAKYEATLAECGRQKRDKGSCIGQLRTKISSKEITGFEKLLYESVLELLENAPQHMLSQHPCGLTFPNTVNALQLVHCAPIPGECLKTHKSYVDAVLYSTYAESHEQCANFASALTTIEARGFGSIIKATALALSTKLSQTSHYIAQHTNIDINALGAYSQTQFRIFLKSTKPHAILHEMTHLSLEFTDDNFGHPKDTDKFKKEVIIPRLADPNHPDLSSESIFKSMSKGCTTDWDGIIECDITNYYKPQELTIEFPAFLVQELFEYDKLNSNTIGTKWVKDWFTRIEQLDDNLIGKSELKEAN